MSRRFKRQVANPLTEISELQVYVDATEGEERVLHVSSEVRIAPAIGEITGRDFKYGPRRASLKFHISGCEAANRARFNDMPLETVEISEVRREAINNDKSASLTVGGKIESNYLGLVPSGELKSALQINTSSATQLERTITTKKLSKFVKPRPNLRWDFEPRNSVDPASFLDDTFISQHNMFSAEVSAGANQVCVDGLLYCRKCDFGIVAIEKKFGDGFFQSTNREAIMNLVLQKALKEAEISAGLLGEEFIVLSKCSVSDEY